MTTLFAVCAAIGGTVLLFQFVTTLLGFGDADLPDDLDVDLDVDLDHGGSLHGSNWFFGVITFRTVVAAMTFFGLAGLAAQSNDLDTPPTLAVSIGAGLAAMYGVHWLMQLLQRLRSEGNVQIERAVGLPGTVYVRIPARRGGVGKIQMNLQNRTVELQAQTEHDELTSGATIVVTRVLNHDTVEVEPASLSPRAFHA